MFLDFGDAEFPLPCLPATGMLWLLNYLPRERVIGTPVISNSIAYENLMVQAKPEGKSAIRDCLGPSRWIDVQGRGQDKCAKLKEMSSSTA